MDYTFDEPIYTDENGNIIFNEKDITTEYEESTTNNNFNSNLYVLKSGDIMSGKLTIPELSINNETQTSAFKEEYKSKINNNDLKLTEITYDDTLLKTNINNNVHIKTLTCDNINTTHLTNSTSNIQEQINTLNTVIEDFGFNDGNITYDAETSTTTILNNCYINALTCDTFQNILASKIIQSLIPTATILSYAGVNAPSGYALCEGQEVSRTGIYADLYAIIGHKFRGSKTINSGTFYLPDLRGMFIRGTKSNTTYGMKLKIDSNLNATWVSTIIGDDNVGGFQTHEVAEHFHIYQKPSDSITVSSEQIANNNATVWDNKTDSTFTTTLLNDDEYFNDLMGDETRPVNISLTYIIKL
jgi:microcystin-dependent protein